MTCPLLKWVVDVELIEITSRRAGITATALCHSASDAFGHVKVEFNSFVYLIHLAISSICDTGPLLIYYTRNRKGTSGNSRGLGADGRLCDVLYIPLGAGGLWQADSTRHYI